jgi:hypothetical protein
LSIYHLSPPGELLNSPPHIPKDGATSTEDGLSRECLGVIEGGLTNTNAIELLAEADCLGLDALKDVCMEYVLSNYGSIKKEKLVDSLSRSSMVELLKSLCSQ